MTAQDDVLKLLSSFEWKRRGKQLVANSDFSLSQRQAIREGHGDEGVDGIGLQFIGTKAYISAGAEGIFKAEKRPLNICREVLAR